MSTEPFIKSPEPEQHPSDVSPEVAGVAGVGGIGTVVAGADLLGEAATLDAPLQPPQLETPFPESANASASASASASAEVDSLMADPTAKTAPADDENKPGFIGERNRPAG